MSTQSNKVATTKKGIRNRRLTAKTRALMESKQEETSIVQGIDSLVLTFENNWKGKMKPPLSFHVLKTRVYKIYNQDFRVTSKLSGMVIKDTASLLQEYAGHKNQIEYSSALHLKIEWMEKNKMENKEMDEPQQASTKRRKMSSNIREKGDEKKEDVDKIPLIKQRRKCATREMYREHDIEISKLFAQYGTQWKKIAQILNRTEGAIKSQHYRKRRRSDNENMQDKQV